MTLSDQAETGALAGITVIEIGDEQGEHCGRILAGLGAEVIRVEPPGGEATRLNGPFYHDALDPDRSLYFWHYNFGKLGVTVDLDTPEGQTTFRRLAARADVVLESRPAGHMAERGLDVESLAALNPALVVVRISPYGDTGPWAHYQGSDLVHLALGGVMMNCGYDPDPTGEYETPPVAPQMWQAYHIAGELVAIAIMGALYRRLETGEGDHLSAAVHELVSKQTESDLTNWIYSGVRHRRLTGRHSFPYQFAMAQEMTKDGRWLMPYRTYLPLRRGGNEFENLVAMLDRYGMAEDLTEEKYSDIEFRSLASTDRHVGDVVARFVRKFLFSRDIWQEAQEAGQTWAPIRKPEENLDDGHWRARGTFATVKHAELGEEHTYVTARWIDSAGGWRTEPRAPLVGEHNGLLAGLTDVAAGPPRGNGGESKGFAYEGVRMLDFGWILASAGAGRFLAAQGAEVIKIEHRSRLDPARWRHGIVAEEGARRGLHDRPSSPNRSGHFMDVNAGKRAISLNLRHPEGKALLRSLIAKAHVVAEGFSPGAMDRMGFGYEVLRSITPSIVYVQQSGMGQQGRYGVMRSYGPTAQAFSGLTDMSGLAEPYPPAGIGYSYLDWFGAYNLALAISVGLYRQKTTGEGCWIDTSQVESGIQLVGTTVLDRSVNGASWKRYGNRSPYKPAAPHGAYRTAGDDNWIAIACFTDEQWAALVEVLGRPEWADEARFASLADRMRHQDALDLLVNQSTQGHERYALMDELQRRGVPAGVCQTAEDRYESDPQLAHLEWLVPLPQSEIGVWPVRDFPVRFRHATARMGGPLGRHGPNYGEDNEFVYGEILGLGRAEIQRLYDNDVI